MSSSRKRSRNGEYLKGDAEVVIRTKPREEVGSNGEEEEDIKIVVVHHPSFQQKNNIQPLTPGVFTNIQVAGR